MRPSSFHRQGGTRLAATRASPAHALGPRWVRDDGHLYLLTGLIWIIFYQNLPSDLAGYSRQVVFVGANSLDRIIKLTMISVSFYLIFNRWAMARDLFHTLNKGLLVLLFLCPISLLWSIDATATMLRVVSLASVLLVCFSFGLASWHPRRFQQTVIPPIMLLLAASLALGVLAPNLVKEVGTDIALKDSWHGITSGKNEFGMLSSVGTILCCQRWMSREGRPLWAVIGVAVAFTCLVLSRSNTSMFSTLLAVGSMYLLLRVPVVRSRYTVHVVVSIAAIVLLYEGIIQKIVPGLDVLLQPIVGLTGKDTTFSARTTIWEVVKQHISLRPLLGSGYGAYWVGPEPTSPSYVFLKVMWFYPTESHNGYLELVNDLGLLGGLGCSCTFSGTCGKHFD
jgi:exopolysaccharide production protein ExoQ